MNVLEKNKTSFIGWKYPDYNFWDSHGIIFIDYLEKRKLIPEQYYVSLLDQFHHKFNKNKPQLAKKNILFYHDNVPAQIFCNYDG